MNNEWENIFGLTPIFKKVLKYVKLDVQQEPGFTIFYVFAKISFFIILILIGILFYKLVRYF